MMRKIIEINEEKCDGCGACADACHEGAIGKAKLLHEDYCDGLGDCLPACPAGAISFVEREALAPAVPAADRPLAQWPVQIKLAPVNAPYFHGADLLIAADCTAYAYGNFHNKFMKNRVTLIGCPKLDNIDYPEKLTAILQENDIKSVTVARMEVPCCSGLERAVKAALQASGKSIPGRIAIIGTNGNIVEE